MITPTEQRAAQSTLAMLAGPKQGMRVVYFNFQAVWDGGPRPRGPRAHARGEIVRVFSNWEFLVRWEDGLTRRYSRGRWNSSPGGVWIDEEAA